MSFVGDVIGDITGSNKQAKAAKNAAAQQRPIERTYSVEASVGIVLNSLFSVSGFRVLSAFVPIIKMK